MPCEEAGTHSTEMGTSGRSRRRSNLDKFMSRVHTLSHSSDKPMGGVQCVSQINKFFDSMKNQNGGSFDLVGIREKMLHGLNDRVRSQGASDTSLIHWGRDSFAH